MFYIKDENNNILLFNEDKQKIETTQKHNMEEYAKFPILQTDRPIVNFEFADTEEYISRELNNLREKKHEENQKKLDIARTSHLFIVTLQGKECEFDTKDKTQSDLNSAAISASIGQPWLWTTNNRITLSLTSEDILIVSVAYAQAVNADIAKWTEYEALIEQSETIEELNNIEIIYE